MMWLLSMIFKLKEASATVKAATAASAGGVALLVAASAYTDKQLDTYKTEHAKYDEVIVRNISDTDKRMQLLGDRLMQGMEVQNNNMFLLQQAIITQESQKLKKIDFKLPEKSGKQGD